jgi:hypothetical protein
MAKAEAPPPPSTYITGFCGAGNHERCPAVIKNNANGRVWDCHCHCHAEGNTGWEPPTMDVSTEAWDAVWSAQENGNGHHPTSGEAMRIHDAPYNELIREAQERWSPFLLKLREALRCVL